MIRMYSLADEPACQSCMKHAPVHRSGMAGKGLCSGKTTGGGAKSAIEARDLRAAFACKLVLG